jgi:hypothetical protein
MELCKALPDNPEYLQKSASEEVQQRMSDFRIEKNCQNSWKSNSIAQ